VAIREYKPADDVAIATLLTEMGYSTSPETAFLFSVPSGSGPECRM